MSIGLIGYSGDRAVGWCSIAPSETYRPFGRLAADSTTDRIWSLACFFIKRDQRGKGFTAQMIAASVKHAKEHEAAIVESYPVDPEWPSYGFMEFVEAFTSAGFREVGRAGRRRYVMRWLYRVVSVKVVEIWAS